jgi:hypothetical protein
MNHAVIDTLKRSILVIKRLCQDFRPIVPETIGCWWHHRQTAKAPVNLRILGGFAIYIDGSDDGYYKRALPFNLAIP